MLEVTAILQMPLQTEVYESTQTRELLLAKLLYQYRSLYTDTKLGLYLLMTYYVSTLFKVVYRCNF